MVENDRNSLNFDQKINDMKLNRSILKVASFTLTLSVLALTSCKKENRKPASFIEGVYIGSGTMENENPFLFEKITITEISDKKVRITSEGNALFSPYELVVFYAAGKISSAPDEDATLGANLDGSSVTIGLTIPSGVSFSGNKQ